MYIQFVYFEYFNIRYEYREFQFHTLPFKHNSSPYNIFVARQISNSSLRMLSHKSCIGIGSIKFLISIFDLMQRNLVATRGYFRVIRDVSHRDGIEDSVYIDFGPLTRLRNSLARNKVAMNHVCLALVPRLTTHELWKNKRGNPHETNINVLSRFRFRIHQLMSDIEIEKLIELHLFLSLSKISRLDIMFLLESF